MSYMKSAYRQRPRGVHVTELSTESVKYHELAFRYHLNAVREGAGDDAKERLALEGSQLVQERIDALIERHRVKSRTICESCGRQGSLRQRGKEIAVWCEECFNNC